ncbi:MAG: divalent-cation tolerance protein CutA [bacterium]
MKDGIVVFVTVENKTQAEKVSSALLNEKLVACVNVIPGIESHYWWEEKIEISNELLLIIKSRQDMLESIISTVKKNHSYSVPEVIAIPILGGNPDYLKWLGDSICKKPCSMK